MPKTTLGIRLTSRRLTSVRLKSAWKGVSVERADVFEAADGEETSAFAGRALGELRPFAHDTLVTSLGADALFQRILDLPFSDRARAERLAPLEAEESLPLPLERLVTHVRVLERERGRCRALLLAAPSERVEERAASFRDASFHVHAIDADPLALADVAASALGNASGAVLIDLDGTESQTVMVGGNGMERFSVLSSPADSHEVLREAGRLIALAAEQGFPAEAVYLTGPSALAADLVAWRDALGLPVDLLPYPAKLLGGAPRQTPPWPSWAIPLGLAIREMLPRKGSPRANFLRAHHAGEAEFSWKRKAVALGVFAAILVLLAGIGAGIEDVYKRKRLSSLKSSVRKVFTDTFPDTKNVVDEVEQLRQRVGEMEERAKSLGSLTEFDTSPLASLRELSQRIPPEIKVEFREFVVEENRIRIDGVTTSFDAIDKIQARLQQYPLFSSITVSDAKAGVEADKVLFKMTVNLGAGERR